MARSKAFSIRGSNAGYVTTSGSADQAVITVGMSADRTSSRDFVLHVEDGRLVISDGQRTLMAIGLELAGAGPRSIVSAREPYRKGRLTT